MGCIIKDEAIKAFRIFSSNNLSNIMHPSVQVVRLFQNYKEGKKSNLANFLKHLTQLFTGCDCSCASHERLNLSEMNPLIPESKQNHF